MILFITADKVAKGIVDVPYFGIPVQNQYAG
jgi:hypothetical protein